MNQPFYDGKKAAEIELKRRLQERIKSGDTNADKVPYKIKAKIVYTYEP